MILTPEQIRANIDPHQLRGHKYYLLSGYFDPIHPGHLAMLDAIPWCGASAIIVVNGDSATRKKKDFSFMSADIRSQIMDHMKKVEYTCVWDETDVAGCLEIIRPDFFVNGGDRSDYTTINHKELDVCDNSGIKILYGFGGKDKKYSSSWILDEYKNHIITQYVADQNVKKE